MRGTGEKMDGGEEFSSTRRAEWSGGYTFPIITIGMEASTEGWKELGNGRHVGVKEICFLCCYGLALLFFLITLRLMAIVRYCLAFLNQVYTFHLKIIYISLLFRTF